MIPNTAIRSDSGDNFFRDSIRPIVYPGPIRGLVRFILRQRRLPRLLMPVTFSDKVFWKMCFDRRPLLQTLCDKYAVRSFVSERVGAGVLSNLIDVVESPDDISWQTLPASYVVKATHGSGWNLFVHDSKKLDANKAIGLCKSWLKRNYYDYKGEWSYRSIIPRIIVEEMLVEDGSQSPTDYKIFCFDGRAEVLLVDFDRFGDHRKNFYNREWSPFEGVKFGYSNTASKVAHPVDFHRMIDIAERLSAGIDMVRVDLYNLNGRIVFGEMTNYPLAGARRFDPATFDKFMGDFWKLPSRDEIQPPK